MIEDEKLRIPEQVGAARQSINRWWDHRLDWLLWWSSENYIGRRDIIIRL